MTERIEIQRTIAAPASDIFAVLCDPDGHVAIDSSGMLQGAEGDPVLPPAIASSYTWIASRSTTSPMGKYDVTVSIRDFEKDRLIAWTVLADPAADRSRLRLPARARLRRRGHRRHVVLRLVRHRPELA